MDAHRDARPRHTWVPYVAAAAGAVLALKAVLVTATDDTAPTTFAVMYLLGLLLGVVAAVGAGLRQRGWPRGVAVGTGGVVLLVLWIMGLGDALKPVVRLATDDVNAANEVPILLAGLVLLALAWRARGRDLQPVVQASEPVRVAR